MADTLGGPGAGVRGGVSGVIGAAAGFNALPVVSVVTEVRVFYQLLLLIVHLDRQERESTRIK